jgi:aminopeptidase N
MFLGEKTFREGVSSYLSKHEYSNAEQNDLWHALTEQGHFYDSLPGNLTGTLLN